MTGRMTAPIPFLDLAAEQSALRPELDAAWARVLDGNALILGPELHAFETAFAAYCRTSRALGVGNGLDAISLALRALGIGLGDEVIVPAHTFVATWLAVVAVGATPVACEPAPGTYNISAAMAAPLLTSRTKAVIAVHHLVAVVQLPHQPPRRSRRTGRTVPGPGHLPDRGRGPSPWCNPSWPTDGQLRPDRLLQLLSDQEPRGPG